MSYVGLPSRKSTSRWKRAATNLFGLADGVLALLGVVLIVDSVRSFFTPDASILGIFLRWPGGRALPMLCGAVLGAALLVRHRACAPVLVAAATLALIDVGEFYVLRADGLKVSVFRQTKDTAGRWTDAVVGADVAREFEDAVLTRARELRLQAVAENG